VVGHQAHHIIPSARSNHPILRKIGMALDDATNGIFLRTATHQGPHTAYSNAIEASLNQIPSNLTIQQTMERVYAIQTRAAGKLLELNEAGLKINSLSEQEWLRSLR
jgi:hypothetical protein